MKKHVVFKFYFNVYFASIGSFTLALLSKTYKYQCELKINIGVDQSACGLFPEYFYPKSASSMQSLFPKQSHYKVHLEA